MNTAQLMWGVLFSAIGAGYMLYGKKQGVPVPLLCGLGLAVYPYFVSNTVLLVVIGIVLSLLPYFFRR